MTGWWFLGVVRRLAATLESGRDSHSYRTGAVLRHRQEAGQRSPRHGHYYTYKTGDLANEGKAEKIAHWAYVT